MKFSIHPDLGKNIRTRRELLEISQSSLARSCGLAPAVISHYENGNRAPSLTAIIRLASSLRCTVSALLGQTVEPMPICCPTRHGAGTFLPNSPITGPVAGSGASSCWAASIEDKPIMLFQSELNKIIDEQEDQIRKLKSLLAEYDLTINDMRDENKIHGHITEASAYYLIKIKPVYLKLCPPNAPITGPQGSGASPCWAAVAESNPPIGIPVLVTDGEDVKLDHQCFHYEINGRILLPSDPRRATTTPERKFARFVGVTHWMHLPFPPNAPITGQPKAAPVHDLVGHEPEKD
jgi:transcriptional regulator with XRE-family HTH domain